MGAIASLITSLTIVYSTVYSDADQRKHQSSASLAFVWEFTGTGDFPTQMASNAENASIWWRHHVRYNEGQTSNSQTDSPVHIWPSRISYGISTVSTLAKISRATKTFGRWHMLFCLLFLDTCVNLSLRPTSLFIKIASRFLKSPATRLFVW